MRRSMRVAGAISFRLACYAAMLWLALWAEARPAPRLPDLVLSQMPYVEWVARHNYLLWTLGYLPIAVALAFTDLERFIRYNVSSGWLALARGVCITLTGLGPVVGPDINAGMSAEARARAFWTLLSPLDFFGTQAPLTHLTKDLFFSGHVSSTALLLFYVWPQRRLRGWMLGAHLAVVATVFLAHLHYTIDVVGAYAITFCLFVLREAPVRRWLSAQPAPSNRAAESAPHTR